MIIIISIIILQKKWDYRLPVEVGSGQVAA